MGHRFQGFLWNLYQGQPGVWNVYDVFPDRIDGVRFLAGEAFAYAHPTGAHSREGDRVLDTVDFTVDALQLDHLTPSLAYIVREKPRRNIDTAKLAALGLRPGPWLQQIKAPHISEAPDIEIDGALHNRAALRAVLLVETPGDAVAYLTDFLLDDAAQSRLAPALRGCNVLVCES
jgi:ribonuclease Z